MKQIGLFLVLGLALASVAAEPQQGGRTKVPRIGVLWMGSLPSPPLPPTASLQRFHQELRNLGYVEGQTIEIESRFGANRQALLTEAAELIQLRVDVIVAMGTAAAWAAKASTTAVPVVFAVAGDPIQFGLVKSIPHPGGNLTGLYTRTVEHSGKRLGLLREVVPGATRIAMLRNPRDPLSVAEFRDAQSAVQRLNIVLIPLDVQTAGDIEPAFKAAKKAGVAALGVLTSPVIVYNLRRIAALSLAYRLPSIAAHPVFADYGGLVGYGASESEILGRTAAYVDQILKGAKPANLPVEQARVLKLFINTKTAEVLGIKISQTLLLQADRVIQ